VFLNIHLNSDLQQSRVDWLQETTRAI